MFTKYYVLKLLKDLQISVNSKIERPCPDNLPGCEVFHWRDKYLTEIDEDINKVIHDITNTCKT